MLRFAPSPTGDLHIGNLRVAIFNYIIAKQTKTPFLIRIEDTDASRNIEGKDKEILSILKRFGITWDKLVYQSDNFDLHRKIAKDLIEKNKAFYCHCSNDFLEKKRKEALSLKKPFRYRFKWNDEVNKIENPSIRLKEAASNITFVDSIKGICSFDKKELDSFVIIRGDGIPTYNFACSVDDMFYSISFIIRGEDHVSNTPKQILIHQYLDYKKDIKYAHLPIILNNYGKKMSKRDSESSVKWLLSEGYLPQAIANYLLLIGNKTPKDIFTINEAIEWFDIDSISKSPSRFSIDNLRYINREHLKKLEAFSLAALLDSKDINIGHIAKIYIEESSTLKEIKTKIDAIFAPKKIDAIFGSQMQILSKAIISNDFSNLDFKEFSKKLSTLAKLNGKELFKPLRLLLTGSLDGPLLSDLYPHLKEHLKDVVKIEK